MVPKYITYFHFKKQFLSLQLIHSDLLPTLSRRYDCPPTRCFVYLHDIIPSLRRWSLYTDSHFCELGLIGDSGENRTHHVSWVTARCFNQKLNYRAIFWCRMWDLNPHELTYAPKAYASAIPPILHIKWTIKSRPCYTSSFCLSVRTEVSSTDICYFSARGGL